MNKGLAYIQAFAVILRDYFRRNVLILLNCIDSRKLRHGTNIKYFIFNNFNIVQYNIIFNFLVLISNSM